MSAETHRCPAPGCPGLCNRGEASCNGPRRHPLTWEFLPVGTDPDDDTGDLVVEEFPVYAGKLGDTQEIPVQHATPVAPGGWSPGAAQPAPPRDARDQNLTPPDLTASGTTAQSRSGRAWLPWALAGLLAVVGLMAGSALFGGHDHQADPPSSAGSSSSAPSSTTTTSTPSPTSTSQTATTSQPTTTSPSPVVLQRGPRVVAVNAGGGALGDWSATSGFSGGTAAKPPDPVSVDRTQIATPPPAAVYDTEYHGKEFTYTAGNLTAGQLYRVRLHFAETWWGVSTHENLPRTFNVDANGRRLLENFSIAAVGRKTVVNGHESVPAVVKEFDVTATRGGQIVLSFTTVQEKAKINAIEIYELTRGTTSS